MANVIRETADFSQTLPDELNFVEQLKAQVSKRYPEVAYVDSFQNGPTQDPLGDIHLPKLVRFDESSAAGETPAFITGARIFIQGIEVSSHVDSVTVTYANVQGHNTVSFNLKNDNNRFVWTERNLEGLLAGISKPGSFLPTEEIKEGMFAFKADRTNNPLCVGARGGVRFAKYDLAPNRIIFSRRDPIRVFIRYPWRVPQMNGEDLWIPAFTGFVETSSLTEDDIRGNSEVSITASDIRQAILHRMQSSTDPSTSLTAPFELLGFVNTDVLNPAGSAIQNQINRDLKVLTNSAYDPTTAVFYDDVIFDRNAPGHAYFRGQPLEAVVRELLVFKEDNLRAGKGNRGVRNIVEGGKFFYNAVKQTQAGQAKARQFLQDYHTFCLFGPKRRPWTTTEVDTVGKATRTNDTYWPLNVRLWFLLPGGGSGPKNIADQGVISDSTASEITWTTRLEVIKNAIESLDYQFYVSGTGDLHCEFPMADFRPEDFGLFKDTFRIKKAAKASGFGDEQDDPISTMVVTRNLTKGAAGTNDAVADQGILTTVAFSPYIAARYGISVARMQIPFLEKKDEALAQQRTLIELQKRNSSINAMNLQYSLRPFILPNRPLHHVRRGRMGTTTTVDYTYNLVDGSCTSVTNLNYVRVWTGYYRKPEDADASKASPQAQKEMSIAGMDPTLLSSIDTYDLNTADREELKVFNTVMGGESLPTSHRNPWGTSDGIGAFAVDSGVYILNPATGELQTPASARQIALQQDAQAAKAAGTTDDCSLTKLSKDEMGPSPKRGSFKFGFNPLTTMTITDGFHTTCGVVTSASKDKQGNIKPGLIRKKVHLATDFRARVGTPLFAPDDGVIDFIGEGSGEGLQIQMITDSGFHLSFFHLDAVCTTALCGAQAIKKGSRISARQQIGFTGDTGRGTGPHLHVEVRDGPTKTSPHIDPRRVFSNLLNPNGTPFVVPDEPR